MLDEIAGALTDGDRDRAEGLLERVRGLDGRDRSFDEALSAGYEAARLSPRSGAGPSSTSISTAARASGPSSPS